MADHDQVWDQLTQVAWPVVLRHPATWPALATWLGEGSLRPRAVRGCGDPPPDTRVRRVVDRATAAVYAALDRRRGYRDVDPACDVLLVPCSPRSSHARALDTLARAVRQRLPGVVIGAVDTPCEWLDVFEDESLVRLFPEPGFDLRPRTTAAGLASWRQLWRAVCSVPLRAGEHRQAALLRDAVFRCTAVVEAGRGWLRSVGPRVIVVADELVSPAWWLVPAGRLEGIVTIRVLPARPTARSWPAMCDETWVWDAGDHDELLRRGASPRQVAVVGPLRLRCLAGTAQDLAVERMRAHLDRCSTTRR